MDHTNNDKAASLRRMISLIEYDLPNIRNEKVRALKEASLLCYRAELSRLCSSRLDGGMQYGQEKKG